MKAHPPVSSTKIKTLPAGARPRERLEALGADRLGTEELLAILLKTGRRGRSVIELAQDLFNQYQRQLPRMARASVEDLRTLSGVGRAKAVELAAAFELGLRLTREERKRKKPAALASPEAALAYFGDCAARLQQEEFWVVPLDQKNVPLREPVSITRGILNASLVHPREVFRVAIACAAAGILVAHNHPSGNPAPSREDIAITRQLCDAGRLLDIPLVDHLIIGGNSPDDPPPFVSMKREGHLT